MYCIIHSQLACCILMQRHYKSSVKSQYLIIIIYNFFFLLLPIVIIVGAAIVIYHLLNHSYVRYHRWHWTQISTTTVSFPLLSLSSVIRTMYLMWVVRHIQNLKSNLKPIKCSLFPMHPLISLSLQWLWYNMSCTANPYSFPKYRTLEISLFRYILIDRMLLATTTEDIFSNAHQIEIRRQWIVTTMRRQRLGVFRLFIVV